MTLVSNIKTKSWSISAKEQGKIVTDIEDISQCMYIILTTEQGTDPYNYTFGCGLFKYIDKPANIAVPNMIREIGNAIQTWEKRATIQKITFELDQSHLTFTIYWTSSFGDSSLVLPVTLQ
jgi:hypothetical protein